jgi:thioredoxin-related protein
MGSLVIALVFASFGSVFAAEVDDVRTIKRVEDFSQLGAVLGEKRLPLLLVFSSEYCHYCSVLESDFLIPMQISGDYVDRAVIRKIEIGYGSRVVDFDGKRVDADTIAERYGISVTPTVVFLDKNGRQLAPKQVGLTTPDYYGAYLDESIDVALDLLRRNKPLRVKLTASETAVSAH